MASYALPCTLIKINGVYPNHKYELAGKLSDEIVTNVSNNICDLGFSCDSEINVTNKEVIATKVGLNKYRARIQKR